MGTRSLTFVYESYSDGDVPVVCMYRQYDGYPEGHGAELAEFLTRGKLVNGLGMDRNLPVYNGMGCLAAAMVANFKTHPGNFYLHAPIPERDDGQDYEYHVYENRVVVKNYSREVMFTGSYAEFFDFCSSEEVA